MYLLTLDLIFGGESHVMTFPKYASSARAAKRSLGKSLKKMVKFDHLRWLKVKKEG